MARATFSDRLMTMSFAPLLSSKPDRCPVQSALGTLAGRWKPLIVAHLMDGPRRFSELATRIPEISRRMLSKQLHELERDLVIDKRAHGGVPPHSEYHITELGRQLQPVFEALARWGIARFAATGHPWEPPPGVRPPGGTPPGTMASTDRNASRPEDPS